MKRYETFVHTVPLCELDGPKSTVCPVVLSTSFEEYVPVEGSFAMYTYRPMPSDHEEIQTLAPVRTSSGAVTPVTLPL